MKRGKIVTFYPIGGTNWPLMSAREGNDCGEGMYNIPVEGIGPR